jgi:hypothetical protein
MQLQATCQIVEVEKPAVGSYKESVRHRIFTVLIHGDSTKEVEEKIGKLQQALTHMGREIGPDREY